ncbi:MAG TPA: DNA polymerase III subunit beta [Actinocrinis sp.]|nr:DNA polymerase III subunit beta [Actinocrinis sp.]
MRVTIERGELAAAVSWAAHSLSPRPVSPSLGGLRLAAGDTGLRVSGFDDEVSASGLGAGRTETPGTVLVSGRLLTELVHLLPSLPVELAAEESRLTLVCGPYRYALHALPLEDHPDAPESPEISGLVSAALFAEAAAQTLVAAGRDESRRFLTGIRIEADGATLRLVATDRYRLASRELPWQPVVADLRTSALVPARTLAALAKSLGSSGQVGLALPRDAKPGGGMLGLRTPERVATVRLLEGGFMEYERVFPTEFAGFAVVETANLVDAVRRTAVIAERHRPVRLSLTEGRISVEADSDLDDQAAVMVEAHVSGPDIVIAPSPVFVLDGLSALGTKYARLDYTGPAKPVVLTGLDAPDAEPDWAYRYLFLPLRVGIPA